LQAPSRDRGTSPAKGERFVPNDLCFEPGRQHFSSSPVRTWAANLPIFAKSALIVLMAQIGSFVPARQAKLPITDRIFTRIGAAIISPCAPRSRGNERSGGHLNTPTPASLVLLDEVGAARLPSMVCPLLGRWSSISRSTSTRVRFRHALSRTDRACRPSPAVKNVPRLREGDA